MIDSNPDGRSEVVSRRKLLKASSGTIAGGIFAEPALGGADHQPTADSEEVPDVVVIDNSRSDAGVTVTFQPAGSLGPSSSGEKQKQEQFRPQTKGANHPDFADTPLTKRDGQITDKLGSIPNIGASTASVIATHRGSRDTTEINIGDQGAAKDEQVKIYVDPDGSIKVNTVVVCS